MDSLSLLRVYAEVGADGYPPAWHAEIKHLVRADAGHRCVRCGHPYVGRADAHRFDLTPSTLGGAWSQCDDACFRNDYHPFGDPWTRTRWEYDGETGEGIEIVEAAWRTLTVHHLNGAKNDCRWFNLIAACQRCHLNVQRRVVMERPWPWPHSEWFAPYVGGFYASKYLGEELSRKQVTARLDELLALGASEAAIERMPLG